MGMTKKVLVLAPHTDDGELGCGGTIAKFVEKGADVFYLAFSAPLPELTDELKRASEILGMEIWISEFEVRNFGEHRQQIIDTIISIRDTFKPDLVLLPSKNDIHQDHLIIHNEGVRALRTYNLLSYELPWNNLVFYNQAYAKLKTRHLEKKLEALKCYKTQKDKDYMDPEFIRGCARKRGLQVGTKYAECFEVIRWLV